MLTVINKNNSVTSMPTQTATSLKYRTQKTADYFKSLKIHKPQLHKNILHVPTAMSFLSANSPLELTSWALRVHWPVD